ncbi:DUF1822 family protein [Trichocoleus sp. FACHB-262]|uniref:DUF1822 family protein n=1 Tax=Trichocoleus sp. FACHB-262 TaxID=2692869 RepID=UPI0016834AD1|nr:DUF1822 family protein [Trichocoleus sp. FACHB-262]MBD2123518.1 DUF1822 family protein [Trichocoleus sp. FACHB-262]
MALPTPKPGEVWELRREVQSPLKFSAQEQQSLYSIPAQRFLQGAPPTRYVMIVTTPEPPLDGEEAWPIVSVMVLSEETTFLSDVDLLIPSTMTGVGKDLLAETWHVLSMLVCNLQQRFGNRFSRAIYDGLITVGEGYHGLVDQPLSQQEIQALGLSIAPPLTHQQPPIKAFHQQEEDWSDVLRVPLAAYHTYLKSLGWADVVLTKTLQAEQELELFDSTPISEITFGNKRVSLKGWLQNFFDAGWVAIAELSSAGILHLAPVACRQATDWEGARTIPEAGAEDADENGEAIAEPIRQLSPDHNETQRRRAAKQLGELAQGSPDAIQALVDLLRSTQDDETLWVAVESLWQIDPGNPAAGVRRVKLIDLGLQVAGQPVALAVAAIQKSDQRIGVLLRVYPTGDEPYLPAALKLILLDEARQRYEVSARRTDLYIQLKFNGHSGEPFSVQVALAGTSVTEDFVI